MNDQTIRDAREACREVEKKIQQLIYDYEADFPGLLIEQVQLNRPHDFGPEADRVLDVRLRPRLENLWCR
ncbi:MAG TPA: hypothetical protein VFD92_04760 [Candidatus Binatia bacterium]|nr:hypothetical protein [Candidatus Binatia bacterium]